MRRVRFSLHPLPHNFRLMAGRIVEGLPTLPGAKVLGLFMERADYKLSLGRGFSPSIERSLGNVFRELIPSNSPECLRRSRKPASVSTRTGSDVMNMSLAVPVAGNELGLNA